MVALSVTCVGTMSYISRARQYGILVAAFATFLSIPFVIAPETAKASSLKVLGGYHWTVLASTKDADNAIGIARLYGKDARVVLSANGWYADVLTPRKGILADIAKNVYWPGFPKDAFLSNGRGFSAVVWKPGSAVIARDTLAGDKPASVSGDGLHVSVRRIKNGDGWTAKVDGSIDGQNVFSLNQPFPDASDFKTSVELVRLNAANPYPDVVFDANTGGAHCCSIETAVTRDQSGRWKLVRLGTYDGGGVWFENADGVGPAEILHGDNAFLYQFASYAESREPLVIEKLADGRTVNVSGEPSFRSRMTQGLRGLEYQAKLDPSLWHSNSFLAAWVAEKVRIGEGSEAWTRMLGLHGPNGLFGVMKCPGNQPTTTCKSDHQVMLPFPEGLMDVLQRGGYFPQQPQRPDTKPAPVQAKVSAPQSPAPSSSAAPSVARPDDGVTDVGTAFFVSKNTLLTNAHVVKGCTQVTTALHGIEHKGTVIAKDASNDLALIRTDMSSDDVVHLRDGARLGEDVSVFGFPLSGLLASSGNFTRGSITAAAGLRDDTRYFQISAPVQPGNSGGPLLDRYGNVVGIVVAKLNALTVATLTDDIAQNVNFAIKASIAESFLRANDVQFLADTVHEKLTPEDIAAKAQSFSVEVECRPAN
jgi:hypothetical protein